MDDTPILTTPIPSALEIAGGLACAVPFLISMSSSSWTSANGQLTSFSYSDPVAIGGGIVGAVCGVLSLATNLKKTDKPKRSLRVLVCVALLAVGAYQTLRGFGIVGVDKPDVSKQSSLAIAPPLIPDKPEKPPEQTDDAAPFVSKLVVLWRDNKLADVIALAQEEVQKSFDIFDLTFIRDTYEESFGKLVRAGELAAVVDGDLIRVEGPLVYENEKLTLKATLVRVDGELRWRGLDFLIPPELQVKPVDADADTRARSIVDDILAAKPQWGKFHPRLVDRVTADMDTQLAKLLAELGPIKSVGKPEVRKCEENATRCVTFAVVGKKKRAAFDVDLIYSGRVWRATSWNLRVD